MGTFLDFVKNTGKEIGRDSLRRVHDDVFGDGFNEAANICIGRLTTRTDELFAQMKAGGLSEKEQLILSELRDLKEATERDLYGFWNDAADR